MADPINIAANKSIAQYRTYFNELAESVGALANLDVPAASVVEALNTLSSAVVGELSTITNDTWFKATNEAGTGEINLFKVDTNDDFIVGASLIPETTETLNIGSATKKIDSIFAVTIGSVANPITDIYATTLTAASVIGVPVIANNTYLQSVRNGGGSNLDIIKASTDNDTVLNSLATLNFAIAGSTKFSLNSSGHLIPAVDNTQDLGTTSFKLRNILTTSLDATTIKRSADTSSVSLCGGSAANITNGSFITAHGKSSSNGLLKISGADHASSHVVVDVGNNSADFCIDSLGVNKVKWSGNSRDYVFSQNHLLKASATNLYLALCGGTTATGDSGGSVLVWGNTSAKTGAVEIIAGENAAAKVNFRVNGNDCWSIEASKHLIPATDGTIDIGSESKAIRNAYIKSAPYILPTGSILEYASDELPAEGFLWANGGEYAIASYPALFARIGYAYSGYSSGDNFKVPDKRQRIGIGKWGSQNLGDTLGSWDHTHTTLAHSHSVNSHSHTVPSHYHTKANGSDIYIKERSLSGTGSTTSQTGTVTAGATPDATWHSTVENHSHVSPFRKMLASFGLVSPGSYTEAVALEGHDAVTAQRSTGNPTYPGGTLGHNHEMPHNHTFFHSHNVNVSVNHGHLSTDIIGRIGNVLSGADGNATMTSGATSTTTDTSGAGTTNTSNPPVLVCNYIIKT